MRRSLFYSVLVVFVFVNLFHGKLKAQPMGEKQTDVFILEYNQELKNQYTAEVFSRLATFWRTPPTQLSFTLNAEYQIEAKSTPDGAEFYVSFNKPEVYEKAIHHGFDIRNQIAPDRVDFSVFVYLNQGALVGVYEFEALEINGQGSPKALVKVSDFESPHLKCKIGKLNFYHSQDGLEAFLHKTNLINRYYTEKVDIESQLKKLKKLQFSGDQQLLSNHATVLLSRYFVNNGFNNVVRELQLDQDNDPLHILPLFQDLKFHTELACDACESQKEKYFNPALNYNFTFTQYIQKEIEQHAVAEQYNEAHDMILSLQYFCSENQLDYINPSYFSSKLRLVQTGIFDAYLRVANQALSSGLFEMSRDYLTMIKTEFDIESELSNQKIQKLEERLFAYKLSLAQSELELQNNEKALNLLSEADQLYSEFQLNSSRRILDACFQDIYRLTASNTSIDDTQDEQIVNTVPAPIDQALCEKYAGQYQTLVKKAELKISNSDFLGAQYMLQQAHEVRLKSRCEFALHTDATELLASIKSAIRFQNLLLDINKLATTQDYQELINVYQEAENIFHKAQLEKQGLYLINMLEYAQIKGNVSFYKKLADHYMKQFDFDLALDALYEIYQKDATNDEIIRLQELLGARMAIADHKKMPDANPKQLLRDYINGDKWFKPFKEAYLMIWKTS